MAKNQVLGIDLARDWDALLVGALAFAALAVLPLPGDPIGQMLADVRGLFGGKK